MDYIALEKEPLLMHYGDVANELDYASKHILTYNCHYGQRKLLLNEIQFLSYFSAREPDARELIIYIGSAPGEKMTAILSLFPGKKFLLIDPNYHMIDAPTTYIYQNSKAISAHAVDLYKSYKFSKFAHRRRSVASFDKQEFLYCSPRDILSSGDHDGRANFFTSRHETLIDDIFAHERANIFIVQDYMDMELSSALATALNACTNRPRVLYISDIRTNLWNTAPTDLDIIYNDIIQIVALNDLRPDWSMFKFHPPFLKDDPHVLNFDALEEADQIRPYLEKYAEIAGKDALAEYLQGKYYHYENELILLQPWAPRSSSESRLIISREAVAAKKFINYDQHEWENRFAYINVYRTYHYNPLYGTAHGYCGCMDCVIEQTILLHYYVAFRGPPEHAHKLSFKKISPAAVRSALTPQARAFIRKQYSCINKLLGYDLHENKSAKCAMHGWNTQPGRRYLYEMVAETGRVRRYCDDGSPVEILTKWQYIDDFKLDDIHSFDRRAVIQSYRLI